MSDQHMNFCIGLSSKISFRGAIGSMGSDCEDGHCEHELEDCGHRGESGDPLRILRAVR
ncbi:hypothetical protein BD309DRAFT_965429 [Dichomitus squalens]|uniref:Uncharacterized protein n=1 Tax=Dichomitus squalens TaxID=114155 RepID=A0A4Q9NPU5_9APHY|nr:hypothetical protein BD309DRAFT_965429 [Dichomitus squalens]TBU57044.1 hypothetical protein BD310DRAFT_930221 [Dichomitus squalens]